MNESLSARKILLEQAVKAVIQGNQEKPTAEALIQTLLEEERYSKQNKEPIFFSQLLGKWRLCLITGTKKAQNRAGILLGKGRYLTQWVNIYLSYEDSPLITPLQPLENREYGQIANEVKIAALSLTLTGPAQLLTDKRILAFDFTRLKVSLGQLTFYAGKIRGGEKTEASFYGDKINKQAFFSYFTVEESLMAARGRGGGLALWGKLS